MRKHAIGLFVHVSIDFEFKNEQHSSNSQSKLEFEQELPSEVIMIEAACPWSSIRKSLS